MNAFVDTMGILKRQSAIRRMAFAAVLLSISACTSFGTHVVDMDVDVKLRLRAGPTDVWAPIVGENVKSQSDRSVRRVPMTTYQSQFLDWVVLVGTRSIGYFIKSKVPGQLCMRFDKAKIKSNMHEGELPFQVTFEEHGPAPTPRNTTRLPPERLPAFTPSSQCFSEGENTKFGFILPLAVLTQLFPSGHIFNLRWEGKSTVLQDRGTGNWVKIRLPIEREGKREELEMTLMLKDAAARLIYL